MNALILMLMLSADPAPLKCADLCLTGRDGPEAKTCFYTERPVCERREFVCKDNETTVCRPVVVNLGTWEPRPSPSEWEKITYYYHDSSK